jgi:hypothetical protein
MTDEQGYNGWSNYETWVTVLWIDNDEGSYTYSRELVAEGVADSVGNDFRTPQGVVADLLKGWMESAMYDWEPEHASVFTDLLHAAFSEVDWYEIADNYLSEVTAS